MEFFKTTLSLGGEWDFKLGGYDLKRQNFNEKVRLPGSLDENKMGNVNMNRHTGNLKRDFIYEGPVVFQKIVFVPKEWRNRKIKLLLERTRVTSVYVDGNFCGKQDSISTMQVFDLTKFMQGGEHALSIEVDNASGIMAWDTIRNSHAVSESTQTNWNGILGRIELYVEDIVAIDNIKIFPDIKNNSVHVVLKLSKVVEVETRFNLNLSAEAWNTNIKHVVNHTKYTLNSSEIKEGQTIEVDYKLGEKVQLWDEFNCTLYRLSVELEIITNGTKVINYKEVNFGMRNFTTKGTQFNINDKNIFLRGKHDACLFPLTGYAPMKVKSWIEVFKKAKAYGINHYRFHSLCPPEAAFTAADIVGIYIQPELPIWDPVKAFEEDDKWEYYRTEALRILDEYGNHPSFVMFAWGNELVGSMERMIELISICKKIDSRHLYTHGSNNFLSNPSIPKGIDYWCTMWTEGKWDFKKPGFGGKFVRGSFAHHTRGHINNEEPSTLRDYNDEIMDVQITVIGHEIGQYQIHPNFKELDKFTGVLKPSNLEIFKENLEEKDLLKFAEEFFKASGALAIKCYREEIETALRTKGFGGFQLLDLQDFLGQGTALVGILDSFMDSKGLIKEIEWRYFCCETVPLLKMEKYIWENNEHFVSDIEIANYGPKDIDALVYYKIQDKNQEVIYFGTLQKSVIRQGRVAKVGNISFELKGIIDAQKLTIEIGIEGTTYKNYYDLWVYTSEINFSSFSNIKISSDFQETEKLLEKGEKVLFMPPKDYMKNHIEGAFIPDFWCYSMFKKYTPPGTLGILCNPEHNALKHFTTDYHSDWQWWHLVKNSTPIILDDAPKYYQPIVQVIDNITRLHKLGIVFEANVNGGKLLVCSIDLVALQKRPEVKQLMYSLLSYMNSEAFNPEWIISVENLKVLLKIESHDVQEKDIVDVHTDFFG